MPLPTVPVWPFRPNWAETVTETLSWMTDILPSQTGSEQRRSLREYPRKEIEYTSLLTQRERARHDNFLSSLREHDYMLPTWYDQHYLDQDASAGDTLLMIPTARQGEFASNGWLIIQYEKPKFVYEIVQIRAIGTEGIEIIDTLANSWAAGSKVYPLQRARFSDPPQLSRMSDATVRGSYRFTITDPDIRHLQPDPGQAPGLITTGLVSRLYTPVADDSGFDLNAGITVGQASMMLALTRATRVLANESTAQGQAASVFYRSVALTALDAVVGAQSRYGAILRQPVPDPDQIVPCIPHWLYAARGDVGRLAGVGEGYEMVPAASVLAAGFASADPAAFRDLDRALSWAVVNDFRPGKAIEWNTLREGMRRANLLGRQIDDGRNIFLPWVGLEVAPITGQPNNVVVSTEVAVQSKDNYFFRDVNGDIIFNIPNSFETVSTLTTLPTSSSTKDNPQYNTTESIDTVAILADTLLGRGIIDSWRQGTAYQNPDQYLFVQLLTSREFDKSQSEAIVCMLLTDDNTQYIANLTDSSPSIAGPSGVRTFLLPRESFVSAGGQTLPVSTRIASFYVRISAKTSYVLRFRAARFLSGPSAAAVAADVNGFLDGDPLPFLPGVAPYRISGYGARSTFIGFAGDPSAVSQTPDAWVDLNGRIDDLIPGVQAQTLTSLDPNTRGITYPFNAKTNTGVNKSSAPLLSEQALTFLLQSQNAYNADRGVLGPFKHTFTLNRPDRFFNSGAEPHTWVARNIAADYDIVFQWRTAEAVARLMFDSFTLDRAITFNGTKITVNGTILRNTSGGSESSIGFNPAEWADSFSLARVILERFLLWFIGQWDRNIPLAQYGVPIVMDGASVYVRIRPQDSVLAKHPMTIRDPALGPDRIGRNPAAIAMLLRSCIMGRRIDPTSSLYTDGARLAWKFLKSLYNTTGDLRSMWSNDDGYIYWYYSEILTTLSFMVEHADLLPDEIDVNEAKTMLIDTRIWLQDYGIVANPGNYIAGLALTYKDYYVLTTAPNEARSMSIDFLRLTEDFDNEVSIPIRAEYDPSPFHRPQYAWWINGRTEDRQFRQMLYSMRGRAVPFWMPTFMADFNPLDGLYASTITLMVENVGYTISGGPRRTREHVIFFMRDGSFILRQIVSSVEINESVEMLTFDLPFYDNNTYDEILRVSFIDLMRLDQDSIQIAHDNAVDGVAQSTTVFRSVKDTRSPLPG